MDMTAKLNSSYSAVQPVHTAATADKSAVAPSAVSGSAAPAKSDSVTSKYSDSRGDPETLIAAVQEIEKFVQSVRRNLEFSIDEASGKVIVKVIASETGEVVRQLPSAEALKIADNLQSAHSLLFDAKV
jgi:flagellar protein FlaG